MHSGTHPYLLASHKTWTFVCSEASYLIEMFQIDKKLFVGISHKPFFRNRLNTSPNELIVYGFHAFGAFLVLYFCAIVKHVAHTFLICYLSPSFKIIPS